jgi:predicted aconitase with swiveling domain
MNFVSNGRAMTKAVQRNESIWFCGGVDGKYGMVVVVVVVGNNQVL